MNIFDNAKNGKLQGIPGGWRCIALKPKLNTQGRYYSILCERELLVSPGDNWVTWLYDADLSQVRIGPTTTSGHYLNDCEKAMEAFNKMI